MQKQREAIRLDQPVTYNIFSPDYKMEECHGCKRWEGIHLLYRVGRYFYCSTCWEVMESKRQWKEMKMEMTKAEASSKKNYIRQHAELSLRELGNRLHMSHEAVRYWRKKEAIYSEKSV